MLCFLEFKIVISFSDVENIILGMRHGNWYQMHTRNCSTGITSAMRKRASVRREGHTRVAMRE